MDNLESLLRPIVHPLIAYLPKPVLDTASSLLGTHCYKQLLLEVNLHDTACLSLALSKGLGIAIVAAASVVKIPQLLKLLHSQSASGVSFTAYLLETLALVISLAYNVRQGFPFSTYGETVLIAVQNIAIAVLVLRFSGSGVGGVGLLAGLGALGYVLFNRQIVDMKMLGYLQAGAGVLGVASKVPQIMTVWRERGTGQLSAFAVFNYLLGSLSRIFTTLQEVDDKLILYGFIAGFALNAVLAAQMMYYWNSPRSTHETPSKHAKKVAHKAHKAVKDNSRTAKEDGNATAFASGSTPKGKSPSTRRRA